MRDEGYIKYTSLSIHGPAPDNALIKEINEVRTELYRKGLIGVYPDGVGFGNLSIRTEGNTFVITGSATGDIEVLKAEHYARVTSFNIENNRVESVGLINASSESMTHGAIYETSVNTNCVIHVHNKPLFEYMLMEDYAATAPDVAYGTPAMAKAITALVSERKQSVDIFVTAGHDEGVIAYGPDIQSVQEIILETYSKVENNG